ncbi:MAG: hypothetical protein ONB46_00520 [candidate division KSB1 bacterium]|nr:hypothetical protein [candidate division KSB1 bacterium]MDZ7364672.1 hypothetical protein [candidate division KSB1 bacterium]MDZ7402580.1 hypothetical protein [candidate division KSB1 bacterium]
MHGWAMPFSILPILTAPKGFNLPAEEDANLLRLLLRGEFTISGFSARNLRPLLADKSPGQISRIIKKLKELFAIPQLANTVA